MTRSLSLSSLLGLSLSLGLSLGGCKKVEETVEPDTVVTDDTTAEAPVEWPDEPFRAERPKPKPIKDVPIPKAETFTLANGLQVYLVQQQALPTVMMFFEWDIGEVSDPKGKTGMASVCADLLDEATKTKDKAAFAAAQSDHAVSIWASPGTESSTVGVRTLLRELGPALDLTAEMLLEPGLREEDFNRLIEQEKAGVQQQKASPTSIGYRVYSSLLWGAKHPYGKIETEASIDALKLADCQAWVKKLKPDGARLWVVGKITEAELRAELEPRFGKWTGKAPKPGKVAAAKPAKGTIFFVHVPGAAQSQIIIGHPGPQRNVPDYEATSLMSAILGGSFSSRINMNIREDKGWAYGARGGFNYSRFGSYFSAASSVRTDATGGALIEIHKEIERMRTSDPTPEELRREQDGALLAMPAEFSTATRTLFSFRSLAFYDLPLDWHAGHQTRLRAVDTKAVRAAAEAHLQAKDHVVLVVGDGAVVLEELEKIAADKLFGGGGIQFLDSDGNPVERPTFEAAPTEDPKPADNPGDRQPGTKPEVKPDKSKGKPPVKPG